MMNVGQQKGLTIETLNALDAGESASSRGKRLNWSEPDGLDTDVVSANTNSGQNADGGLDVGIEMSQLKLRTQRMSGFVLKKKGKSWKKHFAVLTATSVYVFGSPDDELPQGLIKLESAAISHRGGKDAKENVIEFSLFKSKVAFKFEDFEEMERWLKLIKSQIEISLTV
eukprot:TRINITY_DN1268_c0_g1_i2.p1 TRINITY_DN1268_c0_g1~~TRINITY_DN1268_c0_g1_i2.p1  ORF type:complete len:170 (+),score=63.00 TRINITY_DN1268_c0_g1_i2:80-589(+)